MGGLPNGPLSLYGLVPTVMGLFGTLCLSLLVPLPYFSETGRNIRDRFNAPFREKVRDQVFDGFKTTGSTSVRGFGVSESGRRRVHVKLDSPYDLGLGFTMLSACTVAAQIAQRMGTSDSTKPGCNSAVVALGGIL